MNKEALNLFHYRQKLATAVKQVNNLLIQLENESKQLVDKDKQIYESRMDIIADLVDAICDYDELCQRHIRMKPQQHTEQYLRDQLDVAKNYIHRLGGDFNIVLWGKKSDY